METLSVPNQTENVTTIEIWFGLTILRMDFSAHGIIIPNPINTFHNSFQSENQNGNRKRYHITFDLPRNRKLFIVDIYI